MKNSICPKKIGIMCSQTTYNTTSDRECCGYSIRISNTVPHAMIKVYAGSFSPISPMSRLFQLFWGPPTDNPKAVAYGPQWCICVIFTHSSFSYSSRKLLLSDCYCVATERSDAVGSKIGKVLIESINFSCHFSMHFRLDFLPPNLHSHE